MRRVGAEYADPRDTHRWTAAAPTLDPARVLRVQGYKDTAKVRPAIRRAAENMAALASTLITPVADWRRHAVTLTTGGGLKLASGHEFQCPAFDRLLAGASEVAIFVLTLGPAFDAAVAERVGRDELLDALLLESVGWLAIERLTRQLGMHLRTQLETDGLSLGYRMGPGYSYRPVERTAVDRINWPLEQQGALFATFGGALLAVELADSFVMRPKMSRSGLFGIHAAR
jgi:hypothetical protein